ncbi:hypothetical protein FEM48_Zijuj12G0109800 [Ziziphus jujuba var. spinosa]|uniref:BZIP domain-containing protein n=1 Tax=Ziziphus jujuba var. spinosa TaxID=714518 RepID=A0A978UCX3_ZIZJJ|nr:hypothetical protein FEM48_Zijuj12G0109800 [Ziziphus jujuba var. spinosa]
MAQLPPKIPTMTQNWPSFPHQKMPSIANFIPTTTNSSPTSTIPSTPPQQQQQQQQQQQSPFWVDEFLDFTSARRGNHRRSVSDSITFLESPLVVEECRNSCGTNNLMHGTSGFDRLDDDQLMSMFTDDMSATVPPTLSSSNPSTPSDQNSNNDEKPPMPGVDGGNYGQQQQQQQPKSEPGEVESSCEPETQVAPTASASDPIFDPKRVKRILANRQSAQRSRVRKLQYISELERSVATLQSEVSALSPRVAFLDHQRLILNVDNSAIKQRIAALAQDKIFKDAHQEALKKEIERLRQVYHQQRLKKMGNSTGNQHGQAVQQHPVQPPNSDTMVCAADKEQLLN